ncbi:hypothetical protein [Nonomuraea sp. bgisy101]|uniref:hypothetical protein n=1 Tax=Nonomuraea sp. bgisy101 TaxID=3413784 RepID=UPI003D730ED8
MSTSMRFARTLRTCGEAAARSAPGPHRSVRPATRAGRLVARAQAERVVRFARVLRPAPAAA